MSSETNDETNTETNTETNSETPLPKSRRRPRRRRKGVQVAALVLLVSLVILALTALTYRPQWRPLTGTHEPQDAALVMDCPENWRITEVPGMTNNKSFSTAFSSVLTLKMRPLTGLPAWWQKYVLRQENTSNDDIMVIAYALRDPGLTGFGSSRPKAASATPLTAKPRSRAEAKGMLDAIENGLRFSANPLKNASVTQRRVEHSLGPALEIDLETPAHAIPSPNAPVRAGMQHTHALYIVPLTAPPDNGPVMVSCGMPVRQYAFMKPTLERMLRSIRFVRRSQDFALQK